MAAQNGPIKTILAVIVTLIVMCVVILLLIFLTGTFVGSTTLLEQNDGPHTIRNRFHDHRIDQWTTRDASRQEHRL